MDSNPAIITHTVPAPLEKGIVFLRRPGAPSLACSLSRLCEQGCSCITTALDSLGGQTASEWQQHLERTGAALSLDLSAPPYLPGLHLEAQITHVTAGEDQRYTLRLTFQAVEAEERALLKQAVGALGNLEPDPVLALDPPSPALHSSALRNDPFRGKRLGDILAALGKLTAAEAAEAEHATRPADERIGHYLVRRGCISSMDLCGALSLQSGLPMIDLSTVTLPPLLLASFSYLTMLRHSIIPFAQSDDTISVAAMQPLPNAVIQDIEHRCGRRIKVFLAEEDVIGNRLYALQPAHGRKHRRHTRRVLAIPVQFQTGSRQTKTFQPVLHEGLIVNISEGGLCLKSALDPRHGGSCIRATFTFEARTLQGLYGIRHVAEEKSEAGGVIYRSGLELLEMSPPDRAFVRQLPAKAAMQNC